MVFYGVMTPEVILDRRVVAGQTEYLVKWQEALWGSDEATSWVPFWELSDDQCQNLIAEFEQVRFLLACSSFFPFLSQLSLLGFPGQISSFSEADFPPGRHQPTRRALCLPA